MIICKVFANKNLLFSRYISIPIGQRLSSIIEQFHGLFGLLNMCGAIDGTHKKLYQKPAQYYIPSNYWFCHDFHSVLFQGICDGHRNFWNICIVAIGRTHDATQLQQSTFYKNLVAKEILQKHILQMKGKEVDKCLHRRHVKIENNFGILKNRWTILKTLKVDVKHAALVIIACYVLYNFYYMNLDICHIGIVGMQDSHSNLKEHEGISTRITSK